MFFNREKNSREVNEKEKTSGTLTFSSGSKYVGELLPGLNIAHGKGTLTLADGREISGQFQDGKPHGHCVLTFPDGRKYEGEYWQGNRHGWGTMYFTDGEVFEGEWKRDMPHGEGWMFHPSGTQEEGTWIRGKKTEDKAQKEERSFGPYLIPVLIILVILGVLIYI